MRALALTLLVLAACKSPPAPMLLFLDGEKQLGRPSILALKPPLAAETVRVFEPYEQRDVTFTALPAGPLLDRVYGPKWRSGQLFSLVAADGYAAAVPVARFVAHRAWFAVARTDRGEFVLDKKVPKAETVAIDPVYLIWDSANDAVIRAEGDFGWPYQLATVKLTTFAEAFPGLAPPEPVSPTVAAGFDLFTRYCATCHSLSGRGGKVGPELNWPHSVTEYWRPEWLLRWIEAPQSLRAGTAMPGLPPQVPEREKAAAAIVAYLRAMVGVRPL